VTQKAGWGENGGTRRETLLEGTRKEAPVVQERRGFLPGEKRSSSLGPGNTTKKTRRKKEQRKAAGYPFDQKKIIRGGLGFRKCLPWVKLSQKGGAYWGNLGRSKRERPYRKYIKGKSKKNRGDGQRRGYSGGNRRRNTSKGVPSRDFQ